MALKELYHQKHIAELEQRAFTASPEERPEILEELKGSREESRTLENAKRLAKALSRNIDKSNITSLAYMLQYDKKQLEKDINDLNRVLDLDI